MAEIRYNETAILDLAIAQDFIREYFEGVQSPELAKNHITTFFEELARKLDLLEGNPELYPIRRELYYSETKKPVRSFTCHWFIVFYVYTKEDDTVTIWFIRSSKSDYSNVITLF